MEFSFGSQEKPETTCSSLAESSSFSREALLDEEIILASNRPKKPAGRRVFRETRHPVFRGVRRRNNGKWVCEMRKPKTKERIWLGTYPTAEMAARAHDVAAIALRGKAACLNFTDSTWRLPKPLSNGVEDIRVAAAQAARGFEIEEMEGSCRRSEVTEEIGIDTSLLIARIAEFPLFSPRPFGVGNTNYVNFDDIESNDEVSLWNFYA